MGRSTVDETVVGGWFDDRFSRLVNELLRVHQYIFLSSFFFLYYSSLLSHFFLLDGENIIAGRMFELVTRSDLNLRPNNFVKLLKLIESSDQVLRRSLQDLRVFVLSNAPLCSLSHCLSSVCLACQYLVTQGFICNAWIRATHQTVALRWKFLKLVANQM